MNKNRVDIMVDIETLGKESDSTITQVSAIAFDILTGDYIDIFNMIADIEKNSEPINVDGSTLKWWMNTNHDLLKELLLSGDKSSEQILREFQRWIKSFYGNNSKNVYLWGNGILFDNKMIKHQMESLNISYPIFYRNDRDVRTIIDLAGNKLGITEGELKDMYKDNSLVEHNALDDVKYQIKLVVGCYNELIKGDYDG